MALLAFLRARKGGASIVTALSMVALIGFAGLATDVGSVYLESRRLQGTADLAALSAMQDPGQALALAQGTVAGNRWPDDAAVAVERGAYSADRAIPARERFRADAVDANAVRVRVTASAPLYFGRLFIPEGRMNITRQATAAQTRMASFQIGSRLLALEGGVANQVLSGLTGSSVNLSVMDYNALLQADVDLFSYMDALRTRLDLEAANFDRTLAHRVEAPLALEALADVLAVQDRRAERAMRRIADAADTSGPPRGLNQLIDLGPYGGQDHALDGQTQVRVNAMDLASAVLQIAGGERQVRLQLGAGVPGVASANVWLAIGERPNNSPWLTITSDRDVIVRTAQMRLYIEANIAPGGALGLAQVRVPLLTELAAAEARLADIRCGFNRNQREVTLEVAPSIGALTLGEVNVAQLDNFRTPLRPARATLVRTAALQVEAQARIELGGREWRRVRFSGADIDNGVMKTVSTRDAARATLASLLGDTDLSVRVLGLGLGLGGVTQALRGTLSGVAAPLDGLVNGLTDLLGVRLGQADVRVNGVRCGAALVA
ncbi:MAG TPA: TadG family pilus assembly protein [Terricaulis sp.]|nr:TadG family pilus assembly protein [Terricaulis sp.]